MEELYRVEAECDFRGFSRRSGRVQRSTQPVSLDLTGDLFQVVRSRPEVDEWSGSSGRRDDTRGVRSMEQTERTREEGEDMAAALANPSEMIQRGAPHLIHSDEELERYTSMLFQLSEIAHPSFFDLEAIELLGTLIEKYECERFPIPPAPAVDVVRFLMDQNQLSQRDLVNEFGSEPQVSMFLNGHRQLSVEQIRRLSHRFHVGPSAFMQI